MKIRSSMIAAVLLAAAPICHSFATADECASDEKTIVETAIGAEKFSTLVTALKAAGLVDTLQGKGPFTVFAPTDEAFAEIPEETLAALLKDKAALTEILTYHVVSGKVMAADVVKLDSAKTVQGDEVEIEVKDGNVMVNQANVVTTDIVCSNGVIHVIDAVIMPPKKAQKAKAHADK
jgi:uncharacterized surface protein with fasciclin (FAS1) repeats